MRQYLPYFRWLIFAGLGFIILFFIDFILPVQTSIEQIAEDYIQKGYSVTKEEVLGGKYYADIVARKNQEQIVIEVKTGKLNAEKKEKIANLADYVRSLGGYKFVIAIAATPPKEKKLEIAELEQLITNYFHQDLPSELDSLSTHTRPDEVSDIDIDEINISSKSIFIKGNGVVSVEMQFGSDSDQNNDDGNDVEEPRVVRSSAETRAKRLRELLVI